MGQLLFFWKQSITLMIPTRVISWAVHKIVAKVSRATQLPKRQKVMTCALHWIQQHPISKINVSVYSSGAGSPLRFYAEATVCPHLCTLSPQSSNKLVLESFWKVTVLTRKTTVISWNAKIMDGHNFWGPDHIDSSTCHHVAHLWYNMSQTVVKVHAVVPWCNG